MKTLTSRPSALLAPLADNGGHTPSNTRCDIGAFEDPGDVLFRDSFEAQPL